MYSQSQSTNQSPIQHTQTVTSNPDGSVTRQDTTTQQQPLTTLPVVQDQIGVPQVNDNAAIQAKQTERAAQDLQAASAKRSL